MSSNGGVGDATSQNTMAQTNAKQDQGAYNSDMDMYMSNVNSQLAAGNPFQTTAYKTDQNLTTSAAQHSTNDAAAQNLRATALRTGQNANAIPGAVAQNAQQGQMTTDAYDASRDTANEDTWLKQQDQLTNDQLAGANSENSNEGEQIGEADATSGQLIQQQEDEDNMWAGLGETAMKGAGAGLTAAFA
jgi:hypothetical protein